VNLEAARSVYQTLRETWLCDGAPLEANDRLSVITVAAGLRDFAFLNHFAENSSTHLEAVLTSDVLIARQCVSRFDFEFEANGLSAQTIEAYRRTITERDKFVGIGIWPKSIAAGVCPGSTALGSVLGYPPCCDAMDLKSKRRDHELALSAIVEEEGDNPESVARALIERREYHSTINELREEWTNCFWETHATFPFVLHTACPDCLSTPNSPTALQNDRYEELARYVSSELHLMIRWGARILAPSS
jgi:hypothetical protein